MSSSLPSVSLRTQCLFMNSKADKAGTQSTSLQDQPCRGLSAETFVISIMAHAMMTTLLFGARSVCVCAAARLVLIQGRSSLFRRLFRRYVGLSGLTIMHCIDGSERMHPMLEAG